MTLAVFTRRALPYLRRLDSRERQPQADKYCQYCREQPRPRKRKRYFHLDIICLPRDFHFILFTPQAGAAAPPRGHNHSMLDNRVPYILLCKNATSTSHHTITPMQFSGSKKSNYTRQGSNLCHRSEYDLNVPP